MGQKHFEISRKLFPNAQIAVYSDSYEPNSFPLVLTSLEEISNFLPEVSVIANSASEHIKFATFLANLNSHLLIEKPISTDLEGIEEFLKVKKKNKIKVLVGYNLQYLNALGVLKNLLQQEKIGNIFDIRIEVGQNLESWRPNRDYRMTTSAKKSSGGGVLRELSHEINYLLDLFGTPKWVFGATAKVSDLEIDVEDVAHLILGFNSKRGDEFMANLSLDFVRKDKTRRCTIIGSEGTLEWNILDGTVKVLMEHSDENLIWSDTQESLSHSYIAEWKDLIDIISQNRESHDSHLRAINTLEVLLTCEASHQTKSRLDFIPKHWSI